MDAETLRLWLLQHPRPTKVVVVDGNADRHELEIKKTMTWKAVAQSLLALEPDKIQAYDGDKLARATSAADQEPEPEDDDVAIVQDPESQRLIVFAKLLAEGYKHANGVAFQTLSELCRSMTERTQSLEGALRATEQIMMKTFQDAVIAQARADAGVDGDDGGDVLGSMVKSLVAKAATAPSPKPNGAPTS